MTEKSNSKMKFCSFCGSKKGDNNHFIINPSEDTTICQVCVADCMKIIKEEPKEKPKGKVISIKTGKRFRRKSK